MLKNKNKVSISSLNQIFAVPLQVESRWRTAKGLFFNLFIHSFLMYKSFFNKHNCLKFNRFSNKGYALFSVLGKEVLVGALSVATLSHAKAEGISTEGVKADSTLYKGGKAYELDAVNVTGSRAPMTVEQSPKIVSVITRDDIHRAAAQTINDVLKLATGVDVRQRGGFGVQTDISINGGTFDQITILLNGVNISNPQTGHNASDFPVALADIDHIEVLEGAASRVFGTSAFNGAINIVTKKAQSTGVAAMVEGGSFGSFGAQGRVQTAFASGKWTHAYAVSGGYKRSDGGTENSDFEKGQGFGQINLSYDQRFDINAQVGYAQQSYGANTFYSAKFNNQYEKTDHAMASLNLNLHDPHQTWQIAPQFYYNNFKDHYQLTRGKAGAAAGENYHDLDVYGGGLNANIAWMLGKTAVAFDISKERIYSTALGEPLAEEDYKNIHGTDRQYTRKGERTNTNIMLEHNFIFGGFTLSAGVLANKNTGLDNDFRFYPGVDMSYRPDDNWKFFASWNKALRMPTYTDLYISNVVQQGDITLSPEKNSTFKIGAQYRQKGLAATISGFYAHGTNMIDWVQTTETELADSKYHVMNIGKLDNMGYNLDATIYMRELIHNCFITRIKVGYAYIYQDHKTDADILKSLYALEYLKHKAVFGLDHQIWKKLSASWAVRWQQRMNGYSPYTKVDCKLMWDEKKYSIYVKADNITCHRYYDLAAVKQPGLWIMAGASINLGW